MIKKIATNKFVQPILYHLVRLYSRTFRLVIENEEDWLNYYIDKKGAVLLCVYHQQFFSAIRHFKNYKPYRPALMISRSKDGEIIAGVAERTGWSAIRGSSSRGGRTALKQMIRHVKKNRLAAHIVDGPRGPATKVKPGAIQMAKMTNAVIVPFYVVADNAWYFNSWDTFFIPKPFSKVILHFGDMIKLDEGEDEQLFESQRKLLEDTMSRELSNLKNKYHL